MSNLKELPIVNINEVHGRLTIKDVIRKDRKLIAVCQCICGNVKEIYLRSVTRDITKSCGCLQKELACIKRIGIAKPYQSKDFYYTKTNRMFQAYKSNAKNRGLEFSIDKDFFINMIHQPCKFCGKTNADKSYMHPKNLTHKDKFILSNGIDRYNNDLGYTKENCVPCCSICNIMKRHHTVEQFISKCIEIVNFNRGVL